MQAQPMKVEVIEVPDASSAVRVRLTVEVPDNVSSSGGGEGRAPVEVVREELYLRVAPARSAEEDGKGSGQRGDPVRVRDMDAFFRARRIKPMVVHCDPGAYFTKGPWAHPDNGWCMAGYDQILLGFGSNQNSLVLQEPVLETNGKPREFNDTYIYWGGHWLGSPRAKAPEIHGFSLVNRAPDNVLVGGVVFYGTDPRWSDLSVGTLRGRWPDAQSATGKEVFGINFQRGCGGARGFDWKVKAHPNSYVGGVYAGFVGADLAWSDVGRGSLDLGGGNQFLLAGNQRVRFRDIDGRGARSGLYNDYGPTSDVRVDGFTAEVEYAAINHVLQSALEPKRRCSITNSEFLLRGGNSTPFIGLAATLLNRPVNGDGERLRHDDGRPVDGLPACDGWVVSNCSFDAPDVSVSRPFYAASSDIPKFRGIMSMNRMPMGALSNMLHGASCRYVGNVDVRNLFNSVAP